MRPAPLCMPFVPFFDRPPHFRAGKTEREALTAEKFQGTRRRFRQLVWYRSRSQGKRTLESNLAPAPFLGWRIDPGLTYRHAVKVLDRSISAHDVPASELFVQEGPPIVFA